MPITDFLSISNIRTNVPAGGRLRLLRELSTQAAAELGLEGDLVLTEILKREILESTSVGGGVALPHARIPDVERPFGMLTRLRRPIDFNAIDRQPVDLVFLLLLPTSSSGDQLNALAAVAGRMRDAQVVQRLRKAGGAAALYRILVQDETPAPLDRADAKDPGRS